MTNIAVLVLAAGKSSRMGDIKQLLKINNKTLLDSILETTKKVFQNNIFCILGANADKIQKEISSKDVAFIYNENFESGLSSSIVAGIRHLKKEKLNFDGVLVLLGDQPAIKSDYLKEMMTLFKKNSSILIASKYTNGFGVPALIPALFFEDLLNIKGDKGAKAFLNNHKNIIITPKKGTNLLDLDTKEDVVFYKKQIK